MALTLKSSGLATKLIACVTVDDDGTTVKDFVTGNTAAQNASVASPKTGSDTWKSVTRNYFRTDYGADQFSPQAILWSGTQPSLPIGNGGVGMSFYCAIRALVDISITQYLWQTSTNINEVLKISSANKLVARTGATDHTASTTSLAASTKTSVGAAWVYGGTGTYYYGLESGSLAADGTFAEGSDGTTSPLNMFAGAASNGACRGTYFLAAWFSGSGGLLTLSDFQSLHADPIGTLFNTPAAAPPVLYRPAQVFVVDDLILT